MFDSIIRFAQIENGMKLLDLFCGFGSFSVYLAERFPGCQITALASSRDQRNYIQQQISEKKLKNLQVRVEKINDFSTDKKFDRIIAIELFDIEKVNR